jgi:hypothetical protein
MTNSITVDPLRFAALAHCVRVGYMSINDARKQLGLPDLQDVLDEITDHFLPDNWLELICDE